MKITNFATDKAKEENGVWVDIGEGLSVLVARANNLKYRNEARRLGKPHVRGMRSGAVDMIVVENIALQAASKYILLGWKNLQDSEGNELEHSTQLAYELFCDYPDFYNLVVEAAQDVQLFRDEDTEQAEGNSKSA